MKKLREGKLMDRLKTKLNDEKEIILKDENGEESNLLVSKEHNVYAGVEDERDSILKSSSNNVMRLPLNSSGFISLINLEKACFEDSILRCEILNQTIENIVSLLYEGLSVKSQSLVTNILSSDLENSDNLPLDSCLDLRMISTPCCLRNTSNLLSTFSSNRNLIFCSDADSNIFFTFSELGCILQSCSNVFFVQRWESFNYLLERSSISKHLQDLPNHDSSTFESGLSMADFAVCNNIFVNFNSHCNNINDGDYLSFSIEKNLSDFKIQKISEIYDNSCSLQENAGEICGKIGEKWKIK